MIPIRLRIQNFMSYGCPTLLDFSTFRIACVTGDNGVGKSTLLEAITWALWEESRIGAKGSDKLIHQGEGEMAAELVFETGKRVYRVVRQRKKGKSAQSMLIFQIQKGDQSWQDLTEATIKDTQSKINQALHLNYDLFVNSSYLRQGHADEFTVKTPSQRKQILSDILGLQIYDQILKNARERGRDTKAKLEYLENQDQLLKQEIELKSQEEEKLKEIEKNYLQLKKMAEAKNKQLQSLQKIKNQFSIISEKIENARINYKEIADQINIQRQEIENMEKEAKEIHKLIEDKISVKKKVEEYKRLEAQEKILSQKQIEYHDLSQQLAVIEHEWSRLQNEAKRLQSLKICPTCKRPLPLKEADKVIQHLQKEFNSQFGKQQKTIKNKLLVLKYQPEQHQKIKEKMEKLYGAVETSQQFALLEKDLDNLLQNKEKVTGEIKNNLIKLQKIKKQGIQLTHQSQKIEPDVKKLEPIEKEVFDMEENLQRQSQVLGSQKQLIKNLEIKEKQQKKLEDQIKDLTEKQELLGEIILASSKDGVPAMILGHIIPAIEEETNELLGKITDGKMKVALVTKRTTQKGEEIETLDIVISDELGERPYELFSGGEAFRINFALRVALSKLLSRQAGAQLQFLVVDEGFGALDSAGREDIISAINSVKEDFEKILVITHIEEFKEAFQTRVEVKKDEAGSKLEVIG